MEILAALPRPRRCETEVSDEWMRSARNNLRHVTLEIFVESAERRCAPTPNVRDSVQERRVLNSELDDGKRK
jgi:hypothetical protein